MKYYSRTVIFFVLFDEKTFRPWNVDPISRSTRGELEGAPRSSRKNSRELLYNRRFKNGFRIRLSSRKQAAKLPRIP